MVPLVADVEGVVADALPADGAGRRSVDESSHVVIVWIHGAPLPGQVVYEVVACVGGMVVRERALAEWPGWPAVSEE